MTIIKEYSGVIALIILAIMGVSGSLKSGAHLAGSTSCGSITCLEGGLRLVSDVGGDFESDVAAVFASTMNVTGGVTLSSFLKVAGVLSVATTSPSSLGDVVISSAGTTTLMLGSTAASKGTCLQMLNSAGALESVFINGTTVTVVAGSCK